MGKLERIRTVEYDPGCGWIARSPWTGKEILEKGWRWNSRSVARTVVLEDRLLNKPVGRAALSRTKEG